MTLVAWRDLTHRLRRFLVVAVAMSVVFTLLYVMSGLVEQFNQEPFLTVDAVGAESWALPTGSSGPFTSSATLSPDHVEMLSSDAAWTELVVARGTLTRNGQPDEALVIGHPIGAVGSPPIAAGRPVRAESELVIDRTAGVAVGAEAEIGDRRFTVVGLTEDTTLLAGLPVVFMPIAGARTALFGGSPVVSTMVTSSSPPAVPDGVVVLSANQVAADALGPLENAVSSIDLIRGLLWFMAAVIVGGVLYMTVLERQRDIAVLKALGGSNRQLVWSLTFQAIAISAVAVVVAALLQALIAPWFPLTVRVPTRAHLQIPLVAVAVAVVATRAGSARVRSTDPVAALGAS
jgi:putative ABC transport system permease protein